MLVPVGQFAAEGALLGDQCWQQACGYAASSEVEAGARPPDTRTHLAPDHV